MSDKIYFSTLTVLAGGPSLKTTLNQMQIDALLEGKKK